MFLQCYPFGFISHFFLTNGPACVGCGGVLNDKKLEKTTGSSRSERSEARPTGQRTRCARS
jgi:hypothetical protein